MRGARRSRRRHPNAAPFPAPSCPGPVAVWPPPQTAWPPPHRGGLRRGPPAPRRHAPSATTPAPPPNTLQPLPCLSAPVLSLSELVDARPEPVEGHPKPPSASASGRQPDLRVNVAKCRKMSHFFIPPLGECRTLRVKNLTFLVETRPFWPNSVHFLCPGRLGPGRARGPRAGLTSNAPTGDNGGRRANRPQEAPLREARLASHSRSTFLKRLLEEPS